MFKKPTCDLTEANAQITSDCWHRWLLFLWKWDTYRTRFIPALRGIDGNDVWYQRGGATCHISRATIDLRHQTLDSRFINRNIYLHTYIIAHYNLSVRIIDLISHTTYVVCVNCIRQWWDRDLLFKGDSERQSFCETFHGNFYLLSEFVPDICWEKITEEILFVFRFDVWSGNASSNKPTYHLLDFGHLTNRNGEVNWPPSSCDFTPSDYFLRTVLCR